MTTTNTNSVAKFFEAKRIAEKKVSALLRKHGVGYKHGSIVDNGKQGWLISPDVKKQIDSIRAEVETLKPWNK
ncbi:MAG: hypothetical protein ACK47E_07385 [Cyclobacteriaceae bacterium]